MIRLLDELAVSRVLFYPRRDYDFGSHAPGMRPVSIEVEPGIAIGGRMYPAGRQSPAILCFHGNGEIAADYDDLCCRSQARATMT